MSSTADHGRLPARSAARSVIASRQVNGGTQAAILVSLLGLAITQPVLDLLGSNPEFFIAGRYTRTQIVGFGVIVAVVPSLVAVAVLWVARRLHRGLGNALFIVLAVALGGLFGNVLARGLGYDGGTVALASALTGGAVVALLVHLPPGRLFLAYLAPATAVFLAAFLVVSPTSRLISSAHASSAIGAVSVPTPPGPVVVVVFDELPLSSLMRLDGTVNGDRFPAFARLAEGSTWFRNASTTHFRTERAVPQMLSGIVGKPNTLPSHLDLPRNLFSMLAGTLRVERYEAVTDMCPPELCTRRPPQSITQALRDASVVYGHRVLPRRLRSRLPAIDDAWGQFGADVSGAGAVEGSGDGSGSVASGEDTFTDGRLARWFGKGEDERHPLHQASVLERQAALIGPEPALSFTHVVLPHAPWVATPWGTTLLGPVPDWVEDPADPAYDWVARTVYQRHLLQVGAADMALGTVLDRLEDQGVWEEATVVVVADHGTGLIPPSLGRGDVDEVSRDEVYRVPLFIKAPGQVAGEIVDDPASTLDVVPSLADVLDVDLEWEFDGHSLFDGSQPTAESRVDPSVLPLLALVQRHAERLPFGDDWIGLAGIGQHGQLIGRPLSSLVVGEASDLTWSADHLDAFDDLPTPEGQVPQMLTGSVTSGPDRPPELVAVVNGRVAGMTGGYQSREGRWRFGAVLAPFLKDGANEVDLYEVDASGDVPVLRRLTPGG